MADVFLSYKREDAARVRKLVAALRATGLDVWWDEDIPASAPWEATIERALAEAKAVVVCWSPESVASENVRSEARVARADGRLIQVFLKPCAPPLFFGERQGVDLSSWRGKGDDPRIGRLAQTVRKVAAGERAEGGERPKQRWRVDLRPAAMAMVLLLMLGSAVGWWLLSPAKAAGPQMLAVLPFRALNPADANLVDAIWDDTRGAISRNPNLRVLGREAVKSLADKDLDPAGYRKRVGADYFLGGSVQHVGDQVRIKVSLTRTKDSAEVWSDEIGGKLDDVFAFQQRIAREVEGRIRGRIAPGGGAKAQNIATSGEVYAIFANAKAEVRKRNGAGSRQAIPLLKKALAIDPNYAPAWAELGIATALQGAGPIDEVTAEAVSYLKRALVLAPNLANAHAGLAMVQGTPPESEPELRRAVALDPGDAEAWMWLGNLHRGQNKLREALGAYDRALEIEPMFWPAIANKIATLAGLHDRDGMAQELGRIAATGDGALLLKAKSAVADESGHPGERVQILLRLRAQYPEQVSWVDVRIARNLMALGYIDEALKAFGAPPGYAQDYRGIPDSPQAIRAGMKRPVEIWLADDGPALFARLLPRNGRLEEYVGYYKAAFKSPDDFAAAFPNRPRVYMNLVPNLAVDLRVAGESAQADGLLASDDALLAEKLRQSPDDPGLRVFLAQLRAAQGRDDEAVKALAAAVNGGWLPDRMFYATDIAEEPCFARLVKRPDFQAIRARILARIEEERRKVPLALLTRTYPVRSKAAA